MGSQFFGGGSGYSGFPDRELDIFSGTWTGPASSNGVGATLPLGMLTRDCYGVQLSFFHSANNRMSLELSWDNFATTAFSGWCVTLGANGAPKTPTIPIGNTSGATLYMRARLSAGASVTGNVQATCYERVTGDPTALTNHNALTFDSATTRPSSVDVPLTNAWTPILGDTGGNALKALLPTAGQSTVNPAISEGIFVTLGVVMGGVGSEVIVSQGWVTAIASATGLQAATLPISTQNIPANSILKAKATSAGATGNIRVGAVGLR